MGVGRSLNARIKTLSPSDDPLLADILSEPKRTITVDKPRSVTPDSPEGLGRLETINKIAKAFNKSFAKNPKIHREFLKEWEKSGDKNTHQ